MNTLERIVMAAAIVVGGVGCYAGARATHDVNQIWIGRPRAQIEARWGTPAQVVPEGEHSLLVWRVRHTRLQLPEISGDVHAEPGRWRGRLELRPGVIWHSTTETIAAIDARGSVAEVQGASLRWGAPGDANLRWGVLFGVFAGVGKLDDTATPLPSGGLYLGGMLSATVGLVGTFSLAAGSDDAGGAMGLAWGLAPVWWPDARTSLRLGPSMIVAFDPGFDNAALQPGVTGSASYAVVRAGDFVLDLRFDVTAGTSVVFGSLGVGVNLN